MMRKILVLIATALWMTTSAIAEQDQPVVVELFTSQGCSSCPPADAFLHTLAERDDVIALALHVDYWDYIGWKDKFAARAHTERQHAYAIKAGRRSVYTPQMIVQGREDVVGNHPEQVIELIAKHSARPGRIDLRIARKDGKLRISAVPRAQLDAPMTVYMVRYQPKATVVIRRGENAGKTLTYSNIVREWIKLGEWDGAGEFQETAVLNGNMPVVVILQRNGIGRIEAAARLR